MRLIGATSSLFVLAMTYALSGAAPAPQDHRSARDGQNIFRFDTFGDEQLWTDALRMHTVIPTLTPATALAVGLKVDVDALPPEIVAAIRADKVDLTSPASTAVTIQLLRLNAIVGVMGTVSESGVLTKVGITCALCHSTVDDSLTPASADVSTAGRTRISMSARSWRSRRRHFWTTRRAPSSANGDRGNTIRATMHSTARTSSRSTRLRCRSLFRRFTD